MWNKLEQNYTLCVFPVFHEVDISSIKWLNITTANYSGFSTAACANRMNIESNNWESSINLSVSFIKLPKQNTERLSHNSNDMNFVKKYLSPMSKIIIP